MVKTLSLYARRGSLLLILMVFGAGMAQAQTRWLQNVELLTPIKDEYVTRALLDTLAQVIMEEPVPVKRSPEDATTTSYETLEGALFNDGLDFISATHLFIGYRLQANQRQFTSEITHLYFIYRSPDIDAIDVPILYLDGQDATVQRVLQFSGTPLRLNEASLQPFNEQLTFHKLPEGTIVSVGGRIIRDPKEAAAEKDRLLATIRRFMFN